MTKKQVNDFITKNPMLKRRLQMLLNGEFRSTIPDSLHIDETINIKQRKKVKRKAT